MRTPVPDGDVAAVLARASALDAEHAWGTPAAHLDEDALVEIAHAVGVSPDAVRQAVAEHRTGVLRPGASPRTWIGPRAVVVERRIDGDVEHVERSVQRLVEGQLFRRVRHQPRRSQWRARTDVAGRLTRTLDLRHRLTLHKVSAIDIATTPCPDGVVAVRLVADPAVRRSELGWGVGIAAGGAAAVGAALGVFDLALLLAAVPAAGAVGGTGLAVARHIYRSEVAEVTDALEGLLDQVVG